MVDFNNETFRRLIEYSKNRGEFSYTDILEAEGWQDDRNKMYREDEVMLTDAYIYSVGDVVDTMFSFGFEDTVRGVSHGKRKRGFPATLFALCD